MNAKPRARGQGSRGEEGDGDTPMLGAQEVHGGSRAPGAGGSFAPLAVSGSWTCWSCAVAPLEGVVPCCGGTK